MTAPAVRVEVGFGSTWRTEDADIVWTDLTERTAGVRPSASVVRGATAAHGRSAAGTFDVTFENADRHLDPLYTAGPYYGDLIPGVPIRIISEIEIDAILLDGAGLPILDANSDPLYWQDPAGTLATEGGDGLLTEAGDDIVINVTERPIARGFVGGWPQRSTRGDTMTRVPVMAVDGFQNMARAPLLRSVLADTLIGLEPQNYYLLAEPSGAKLVADIVGDQHGTTIDEPQFGENAIERGLLTSAYFDGVNDRIDLSRSPLLADEYHATVVAVVSTTTAADVSEIHPIFAQADGNGPGVNDALTLYINDDGKACIDYYITGLGYSFESAERVDDGAPHLIIAQSNVGFGSDYGIAVDSATLSTTAHTAVYNSGNGAAIGGTPNAARGYEDNAYEGRISDVALFPRPITAAERQSIVDAFEAWANDKTGARLGRALNHIDWPTDLRDIATGRSFLGPAEFVEDDNALTYARLIEATEDGSMFVSANGSLTFRDRYWRFTSTEGGTSQFTFSDDGTLPGFAEFNWAEDDELVINSVRYSRRGGGEIGRDDATSQALYGMRSDQQSDLLLGTDAEVNGRAHWTLLTRKDAKTRVEKIVVPIHAYDEDDQSDVLALDLGYRVTCVRTPQGVGDAISREFHIDGIQHRIGVAEWWVEFYVSPAVDQDLELFTLGTSTLGGSHVLAH